MEKKVYIVQCKEYDEVEDKLAALIDLMGGMGRFVNPGDDVIVKPNICIANHEYQYAATTNPWVVAALVKLCFEAGAARVRVMDYPFGGTCEQAYARSGIAEQVQAAGGIMEIISSIKFDQQTKRMLKPALEEVKRNLSRWLASEFFNKYVSRASAYKWLFSSQDADDFFQWGSGEKNKAKTQLKEVLGSMIDIRSKSIYPGIIPRPWSGL